MIPPASSNSRSLPPASPGQADAEARDCAEFLAAQDPLTALAASWHVRRQDGLTAGEAAELREWLGADPAHQAAFDGVDAVWMRLDALPAEGIAQIRAGRPALGAQGEPATLPKSPGNHRRPERRSWLFGMGGLVPRIATAAIVFAVAGAGWLGWDAWRHGPTFSQTYVTARGQQLDVQLPDGSMLTLDTATRAEVRLYRERREVRLPEGQALFTVKADASQPFDVLAGPVRITVVGTRFSVRHTRTGLNPGNVNVAVESGRVRVATAHAGATAPDTVELTAGQSIQTDGKGSLPPGAAPSPASAMLWREGRVNFDRTPLSLALAEFERYGATRLVITDPAVAAMRINGSFDPRRVDAFTKALPQVLPVRLLARDGVTEVAASR